MTGTQLPDGVYFVVGIPEKPGKFKGDRNVSAAFLTPDGKT